MQDGTAVEAAPVPVVALPTVVADGTSVRFRALDLPLALTNVVVVLHPGWPIEHPAERIGDAVRLWPGTGAPLHTLPRAACRPVRFAAGPELRFAPGPPRRSSTWTSSTAVMRRSDGGPPRHAALCRARGSEPVASRRRRP